MNKVEIISFPSNYTEEDKIQTYSEYITDNEIDAERESFLEQENEARQAYRSLIEY